MARFIPVGEAVTRGEQKMLDYLQHTLPDDWVVFGNAQFTTGELTREVDAIVVDDRCVWVVDEKGFGARITGDEHTRILADTAQPGNVYSTTCCMPPRWSKKTRGRQPPTNSCVGRRPDPAFGRRCRRPSRRPAHHQACS
jgi:hypothetical protein